ncbi:MAG: gamma-glutamyl-gamma-aminobutyrate hydrolase family protein [Actinocatenispora sp.]
MTGYIIDPEKSRELGFGPRSLDVTPGTYHEWVRQSGMLPVPVPSHSDRLHADYLDLVDGLLLTGGADITPERYNAPEHSLAKPEPTRDRFELSLLREALRRNIPILGICRGLQLLNVAFGGTLHQHLPERSTELVHSSEYRDGDRHPGDMWVPAYHDVTVTDPELRELTGGTVRTNSYHHQGVARLGDGLAVAARAADGLVEAVVGIDRPVLGVQWHPEMHKIDERAGIAPFRWLARRLSGSPVLRTTAGPTATVTAGPDEALALN